MRFLTRCLILAGVFSSCLAQAAWLFDSRSPAGPVAMVQLSPLPGRDRIVMIAFEISRKCDPIFSYVEMKGRKFGTPEKQIRLPANTLGARVNGKHYTGNAASTLYSNGFELGFGMPNDMALLIAFGDVRSLSFIPPNGQEIVIPTTGLRAAVDAAMNACVDRI